ncbi:MAG: 2-amino-4-hydroxy-6-hydroxymethyldihydropteridine diphosphokinase [Candidatus Marinimicrobia bacterium]|jgi:2-amino-4-hydroxy-6-hydroxymethyldihydropteridine diphosphokinase|nr:2-amino-4-hydroxy-6-hydroxymethyldihydropteridine diphosphokinase [Gammaproteobacteria bacterium]MBL6911471.1 2-amino-4-hydroxy-6-hydroxymethyldihydropteridine diphosphokinase [Candidatus Neomarinimicrobiota bacterium]MBT3727989.1 2-amino-4-hydroxy-6-hydroxymethyldihydropteridine diphosphokinase [Candidatus Neomarinimicrobiota bacterium]MBT3944122.1 2-amino-4-hydroxy-6-hydroxymethyldihydropteridine diphosphokinase [Candidatus Neomarinimicrobiota bacterium]MBT4111722.1 2-amino-4-hydroxy-6-hyd
MSNIVYLSLGSNLGDKESNIASSIAMLGAYIENTDIRTSSFYLSEPLYNTNQPAFINIIVELNTLFTPFQFLDKIHDIEKMLGRRIDREKNSPRTIDIDIVLFGDAFIQTAELTIPHSHALLRKFVLVPLAELVPEKIFLGTKHKMIDLLEKCPDTSTVDKYLIDKKA